MTGRDGRALPRDGFDLDLAQHVGAVTLAAGELDAATAGLVLALGACNEDELSAVWGQSGTELTKRLRRHFVRWDPLPHPELDEILRRYDALYAIRNHMIHSIRVADGAGNRDLALFMNRHTRGRPLDLDQPASMTSERLLGISELVDLWYDIRCLTEQVRQLVTAGAALEITGAVAPVSLGSSDPPRDGHPGFDPRATLGPTT